MAQQPLPFPQVTEPNTWQEAAFIIKVKTDIK